MKSIIVLLLLLLSNTQLVSQNKTDLRSDKAFTKVFKDIEINGLNAMVQYVDQMVLEYGHSTDINEAYHFYFEGIKQAPNKIPFREDAKYEFLKSLDSLQLSTVWRFERDIVMIRIKDTVYRNLKNFPQLYIKPFSKYMLYLENVGKGDAYYYGIRKKFENAGGFSTCDANWFARNHSRFDFNIPKNRLWAAINLLSREETTEMKFNRYIENQKAELAK
ncbi:hypothetical protein [Arenibacter certesii]|uniref:GLPGLI family protein n=1 Tax=Arenibacter certesii TaxID=228955 RepID=A0A918MI83_9FLAO|nr:hypothetical protein [Arenibacter certesii]GGW26857.1 hypothetical protein GCM10007383_10180 [Arenibacter certesii]